METYLERNHREIVMNFTAVERVLVILEGDNLIQSAPQTNSMRGLL